jgi:SH3-like domain-containing protein
MSKTTGWRMAGALLTVIAMAAPAWAAPRQTPSGLPVPRYVTLKFDKVNARAGPGDDYPARWVYRVPDLPVQVVAETAEWRKVCDPEGQSAWVHKRTTDGRRSVIQGQFVVPHGRHPARQGAGQPRQVPWRLVSSEGPRRVRMGPAERGLGRQRGPAVQVGPLGVA